MATTKSVEYAKFDTLGLTRRPDSIQAEGRARYLNDVIEFESADTVATKVKLLPLPKGALVDLSKSAIITADTITAVSVHVGTDGEQDNLASSLSIATAGTKIFSATQVDLVEAKGDLILEISAGTVTKGDKIRVSICYYIR